MEDSLYDEFGNYQGPTSTRSFYDRPVFYDLQKPHFEKGGTPMQTCDSCGESIIFYHQLFIMFMMMIMVMMIIMVISIHFTGQAARLANFSMFKAFYPTSLWDFVTSCQCVSRP